MGTDPILHKRKIADITAAIEEQLNSLHWRSRQDGAGRALAQLYGRLAEVMANRLNQSLQQHFRVFLNEAGIDRLAPRSARTDISFFPAADGPAVIQAPQGTQIVAPPTENRPEIVFETTRAINVVPTALERCIVVDRLNYSDQTARARGETDKPFAAFVGEIERERVLYLAHDRYLHFADDASRENAQVVLTFEFECSADPAADDKGNKKWRIEWCYWDGEQWRALKPPATDIRDETKQFRQNGTVVITNLPLLQKSTIHGQVSYWLAAKLTGGTVRDQLPTIKDVHIYQRIFMPPPEVLPPLDRPAAPAEVPHVEGFTKYAHEDRKEQRYFLGHPDLFIFTDAIQRLRAEYTLTFLFETAGSPPMGDNLTLEWLYWDYEDEELREKARRRFLAKNGELLDDEKKDLRANGRWRPLVESGAVIDDRTERLSRNGVITLHKLPELTPYPEAINGAQVWLAFRLTSTDPRTVPPTIREVRIRREIPAEPAPIDALLSAIQSGSIFVPLDVKGPLLPLGAVPLEMDSFYLQIDSAFTKAGATVTINFDLEGLPDAEITDSTNLNELTIKWEYFSKDRAGWVTLGICVRGCPTLEAYNFDAEPDFGKPRVVTVPFTRRKVLEFKLPAYLQHDEAIVPGDLPLPFRTGKIVTDIYTGEHFVQIPIPPGCANLPEEILINGCYRAERLNFRDKTCAFTAKGNAVVEFTVPKSDSADPQFAPVDIGGVVGYWIRARIIKGNYNVPQKAPRRLLTGGILSQEPYLPPITYAPVVMSISAQYSNYLRESTAKHPNYCLSRTDARWRDHRAALRQACSFDPYRAVVVGDTAGSESVDYETPALYLGFYPLLAASTAPAFSPGYWIELRIDLEEAKDAPRQALQWEYWNGNRWRNLRAEDRTMGFARPEYFGFVAPDDHAASDEFGYRGYWFRIRRPTGQPATVGAGKLTGKKTVTSTAPSYMPMLKQINLNYVPIINSETITAELIGSSSGAPNQLFTLTRKPVLADVEIEVREPDQRTESESAQLGVGQTADRNPAVAQTVTAPSGRSHEDWVRWQQVPSFYGRGPTDRCYVVDQESGQIRFGDGRRGRIPPPGINNIRAGRYRAHSSEQGLLDADTIIELRNPSGPLNDIQTVTNRAGTSGGFAVESLERAKRRGPNALKNRQRAVTAEDYHWLALEIDGVERAHGIPTQNAAGATVAGSVTVVVIPKPTDALPDNVKRKLVPTPALLRLVEQHLAEHILSNLRNKASGNEAQSSEPDVDQIYVVGPKYVAVQVTANVIPTAVEKADSVRIAVLARLDEFLHPVRGGAEREGWQPGRSVYLSEVAAEIEHVDGVDHVAHIALAGESLLQQVLSIRKPFTLQSEMPAGSQVSTFDEVTKMVLTTPLPPGELGLSKTGTAPTKFVIHGFKRDDWVKVATVHNVTLYDRIQVEQVLRVVEEPPRPADPTDEKRPEPPQNRYDITFHKAVKKPATEAPTGTVLYTANHRVRLSIVASHVRFVPFQEQHQVYFAGVRVAAFAQDELISLVHPLYTYQRADFVAVSVLRDQDQANDATRIFIPSDHLVYSGDHTITIG